MKITRRHAASVSAHVTVSGLPLHVVQEIIAVGTVKNPHWVAAKAHSRNGYVSAAIPEWVFFAWEDPDHSDTVHFHRGFNVEFCSAETKGCLERVRIQDHRTSAPVSFPKPLLTLSSEQQGLFDAGYASLFNGLRPYGNCLLIASTAVGKTVLLASLAAKLGHRTLVIAPTDLIAEAWYNDLKKLYNLSVKDIGLIKQSKWIIGNQFTIASAATMHRRQERWPELHSQFGTLVLDETQTMTAPSIFECVTQFPCRYWLSATATAAKNGRTLPEILYVFGSPVAVLETNHAATAFSMPISAVRVVETAFQYEYQQGNLQWHDLAMAITGDEARNRLLIDAVVRDWTDGRVVVVVTKTHEHVEVICTMLKEKGIQTFARITGKTNPDKAYTRGLIRNVNRRKCRVIVSTIAAISTGANIRALDSLHIAMPPVGSHILEQLFGRLRRKHDAEKSSAEVTWYVDIQVPYLRRLFAKATLLFNKMKIPGYENKASWSQH